MAFKSSSVLKSPIGKVGSIITAKDQTKSKIILAYLIFFPSNLKPKEIEPK